MIPTPLLEKFGRVYAAGDLVFCEFEDGSECFVVHSGEVSIIKISGGSEKILAILKEGDIFGEMGVLEKKPRTATAMALTELTVLALDLRGLQAMVQAQPFFAFTLGKTLGRRIIQSFRHVSNLSIENPRVRVVDMLLWKMEEPKEEGGLHVTPHSLAEIADFVGLPFQEVERVMKEYSDLGRVKILADKIVISDVRSMKRLLKL
ncbi:MAG: Crp/Fnr family transcriptional regulator [Candidatus Hydrogenedentota bacterium]